MEKILKSGVEYLHIAIVLAGIVANVLLAFGLFAAVIFFFGEHSVDPGDILRLFYYLYHKPVLAVIFVGVAAYSQYYFCKFFDKN